MLNTPKLKNAQYLYFLLKGQNTYSRKNNAKNGRFLWCLSYCLFLALYPSYSHAKPTQMYGRSWNRIVISGKFNEQPKLHYLTELETRLSSRNNKLFDLQGIRQGFGFSVNDKTTLWLGGDYFFLGRFNQARQENRIWTQILYKTPFKQCCHPDIDFTFRSRLERRHANHLPGSSLRLRQQLQVEIPILNEICPNQYKAVLFDEIFFNLNKVEWIPPYLVNQNRLFIGFNRRFCDDTSITLGYLNQYVFRRNLNHMNHVVFLFLYFK